MNESTASDERSRRLASENVHKLLILFSIPSVTGMVVHALANVVDRIFIGQGVGTLGIAGLTVAFPLMLVNLSLNMLVGLGATAVISIRLGQKRREEAEKILGTALVLTVLLMSIVAVCFWVWLEPLLLLFGASTVTLPIAMDYMRIILLIFPTGGLAFVMHSCTRGEGNPTMAMIPMIVGSVVNMILDPIFIFGLEWGVQGAAWATVISNVIPMVWFIFYYNSGRSTLKIKPENLRLTPAYIKDIVSIGFAPFAMQLVGSVVVVLLNHQLTTYGGDVALSVMGVIFSVNMMILVPAIGIAQGAQPIIGYNFGAKDYSRVKQALFFAIKLATGICLVSYVIIMMFPRWVFTLYNAEELEFIDLGVRMIRIAALFFPVVGFQIIGANFFQSVGKAKYAAVLTLSRQLILLVPALLILPMFFGLNGVVAAAAFSDGGSAILTGTVLAWEIRRNF